MPSTPLAAPAVAAEPPTKDPTARAARSEVDVMRDAVAALNKRIDKMTGARTDTGNGGDSEEERVARIVEAVLAKLKGDQVWRTFGVPCGHDVMVDMPDKLAEILMEVA